MKANRAVAEGWEGLLFGNVLFSLWFRLDFVLSYPNPI